MSNEPIERKIEFIIEHQASFSVEMEKMRESQAAFSNTFREELDKMRERYDETERRIDKLSELALSMFKLMSDQGQYIAEVDSQVERLVSRSFRHEEELETVTKLTDEHEVSIDNLRLGWAEMRKRLSALERNTSEQG